MTNFFNPFKNVFNNLQSIFGYRYTIDEQQAHLELVNIFKQKKKISLNDINIIKQKLIIISDSSASDLISNGIKKIKNHIIKEEKKQLSHLNDIEYKKFIKNEFKRVYVLSNDKVKKIKKIIKPKKNFVPEFTNDVSYLQLPQWWDISKGEGKYMANNIPLNEILEETNNFYESDMPSERERNWFSEKNVKKLNKYFDKINRKTTKCYVSDKTNICEKCILYKINRKIENEDIIKKKELNKEELKFKQIALNRWFSDFKDKNLIFDRIFTTEEKLWLSYLFYKDFNFQELSNEHKGIFLNYIKKQNIENFHEILQNKNDDFLIKKKQDLEKKELFKFKEKMDTYINEYYKQDLIDTSNFNNRPVLKENGWEFPHNLFIYGGDSTFKPEIFRPVTQARKIFQNRHPRFKKNLIKFEDKFFEELNLTNNEILTLQNPNIAKDEDFIKWKNDIIKKQEQIYNEVYDSVDYLESEEERQAEFEYKLLLKERYIEEVQQMNLIIEFYNSFIDIIPKQTCTLVLNEDNKLNSELYIRSKQLMLNLKKANYWNEKQKDKLKLNLIETFPKKWYQTNDILSNKNNLKPINFIDTKKYDSKDENLAQNLLDNNFYSKNEIFENNNVTKNILDSENLQLNNNEVKNIKETTKQNLFNEVILKDSNIVSDDIENDKVKTNSNIISNFNKIGNIFLNEDSKDEKLKIYENINDNQKHSVNIKNDFNKNQNLENVNTLIKNNNFINNSGKETNEFLMEILNSKELNSNEINNNENTAKTSIKNINNVNEKNIFEESVNVINEHDNLKTIQKVNYDVRKSDEFNEKKTNFLESKESSTFEKNLNNNQSNLNSNKAQINLEKHEPFSVSEKNNIIINKPLMANRENIFLLNNQSVKIENSQLQQNFNIHPQKILTNEQLPKNDVQLQQSNNLNLSQQNNIFNQQNLIVESQAHLGSYNLFQNQTVGFPTNNLVSKFNSSINIPCNEIKKNDNEFIQKTSQNKPVKRNLENNESFGNNLNNPNSSNLILDYSEVHNTNLLSQGSVFLPVVNPFTGKYEEIPPFLLNDPQFLATGKVVYVPKNDPSNTNNIKIDQQECADFLKNLNNSNKPNMFEELLKNSDNVDESKESNIQYRNANEEPFDGFHF